MWIIPHIFASFMTNSSEPYPCKESIATDIRASSGHFMNQSIVQQFTKDGNIRHRRLMINTNVYEQIKIVQKILKNLPESVTYRTHAQG